MNYTYSSITRVLSIQHKGRVKTYSDINLFGIEACIKDFVNTWGYRHDRAYQYNFSFTERAMPCIYGVVCAWWA